MLIGHDKLIANFKRLVNHNQLSHGYIFFGEPQVGKFSFALGLATYLEIGKFELPNRPLSETLVIRPDDRGIISIDLVRELRYYLLRKPVNSSYRVAIIDEADKLTSQAEHAALKIAEEPPPNSLIIFVLPNPEILLATLQSRFQKIYFPRISSSLIINFLTKSFNLTKEAAARISEVSFGRVGRAVDLTSNQEAQWRRSRALSLLSNKLEKRKVIEMLLDDTEKPNLFFTDLTAELARDPMKNLEILRSITARLTKMSQFTTNRRLQLESALWNI